MAFTHLSKAPVILNQHWKTLFRNHWGSAIIPYTLDAAFSDSDRAVIAQGIAHVEENSCLRFLYGLKINNHSRNIQGLSQELQRQTMCRFGQETVVVMQSFRTELEVACARLALH